jgi:fermentation-respiration switch protein FrsA (DUF1100 family)
MSPSQKGKELGVEMEKPKTESSVQTFEKQRNKKDKPFLIRVLKFICFAYLAIMLLMWIGQSWLMFPGILRPGVQIDTSHPNLKTVEFVTGDNEKLQGLLFQPESSRGLVIICHGNGDILCYMEEEVQAMGQRFGVSVLAFDYRGFGNSEGFPNSQRLYDDGQAAYDFAVDQGFSPNEIVVYGRSLGGAIAVSIAAENEVAGLGLRSTFSYITDVAAEKYFWLPVRWLLSNRFPSADKIPSYQGPLVQRHGTADGIVPIKFGRELHDAAINASSRVFVEEEGLGHNQPCTEKFWSAFGRMLDGCLPKQ